MMKRMALVLLLAFATGGCNLLEWPMYVLFGQSQTKVKAEYTGLESQRIALIIAGEPEIDFEDPYARTDLALASAWAIGQYVKRAEFVDQEEIDSFQQGRVDWYNLPMSKIAARFDAQRVIYLDLIQFRLRELNSVNLLRGRIWARVRVYEAESARPNQPVYETEVQVVCPKHSPTAMSDTARVGVRKRSISLFAEDLSRKFYTHKKWNR